MHALALLDKSRFEEDERRTLVKVIGASSVETLLRPASSTTLKVTRHSIAALAAVQVNWVWKPEILKFQIFLLTFI